MSRTPTRQLIRAAGLLALAMLSHAVVAAPPVRKYLPTTSDVELPDGAVARLATLPTTQFGEGAALAVAADGRLMASAGWDPRVKGKAIHLLNADTGMVLRTFPAPGERLEALAFSPDGKFLAVAGWGLWLLETGTGKVLHKFAVQGRPLTVNFSADGKTVWAGGMFKEVVVWDVASGKPVREHRPKLSSSPNLRESGWLSYLSPDGLSLACAIAQERPAEGDWRPAGWELRVQDATTGKERIRLKNWQYTPRLAFSTDGRLLAHPGPKIGLIDLRAGKLLAEIAGPGGVPAAQVLFAPDGKSLLSMHSETCKLLPWDVTTRKMLREISWREPSKDFPPAEGKVPLTFAPDGKLFWLTEYGLLRKWSTATGAEVHGYVGHTRPVERLSFTEEGRALVTSCGERRCTWDVATWQQTSECLAKVWSGKPGVLAFGWQKGVLAVRTRQGVQLEDALTGRTLRTLEGVAERSGEGWFSADGDTLLVSRPDDRGPVQLFQTDTGKRIGGAGLTRKLLDGVSGWAGNLAAGHDGDGFFLCDLVDAKVLLRFGQGAKPEGVIALFSPDRKYLLTAYPDPADPRLRMVVQVRDVRTGSEVCQVTGEALPPTRSFAFSADGRFFAVGGEHGLSIFEVATGTSRGGVGRVPARVLALDFSPDGKFLASGLADSSVLVWNVNRPLSRKLYAERLTATDLDRCWAGLAEPKAASADEVIWRLVLDPERAVAFLKDRVKPLPKVTTQEIRRWVAGLDARSFGVGRSVDRNCSRSVCWPFPNCTGLSRKSPRWRSGGGSKNCWRK